MAGQLRPDGDARDAQPLLASLRASSDVTEVDSLDKAVEMLRTEQFDGIVSDAHDFLPLERALASQQSNLILNTIGEGVCIVDGDGRCSWMNRKMQAWPARVHDRIRATCAEAFELFSRQVSPMSEHAPAGYTRSKRYALTVEESQFLEMIASPVVSPAGKVVQVVAVVWDATGSRRLQQKIDAIDKAGRELVRLEADALIKLDVGERLKVLEEKIVSFTKELMHFDHFNIRLLDRKSGKLELVIASGLPPEALQVELFAQPEGNGISGYVAATGRSYICPDVERDPRYIAGLDQARSSLTVPLRLHDKIIGVFNIESRQKGAFNEDDRQFADIFGRYVAVALNILDLMIVERVKTSHKVADDVTTETAGPLNDIASEVMAMIDDNIANEELAGRMRAVLENVRTVQTSLRNAAAGPQNVLGVHDHKISADALLNNKRVLVADDEPNIRATISDILRKYGMLVSVASNGAEGIALLEKRDFDLVLSDIKMPDKSGYDVFASAKKRNAAVPVILMTGFGYDPHHSIVRASQEGLAAVLFKPFKVDMLLSEVRKALAINPA